MNDEYEWPEGNEYPDGGDMARIISGFTMKGLSLAINSFKNRLPVSRQKKYVLKYFLTVNLLIR